MDFIKDLTDPTMAALEDLMTLAMSTLHKISTIMDVRLTKMYCNAYLERKKKCLQSCVVI